MATLTRMRFSVLPLIVLLSAILPRGGSAATCEEPSADSPIPDVRLRAVASGFDSPVHLTHARDRTQRLFVVEQAGLVRVVERGEIRPEPFLDIRDRVESGNEKGLLSIAFHPRFRENRRLYVDYTTRRPGGLRTIVSQFLAAADLGRADPASERIVLRVPQPFDNHNGGQLAFGPDGFLYITLGDGGSANDPNDNAQDLGTLLGKILRIDVDSRPQGSRYGIPPDNPFAEVSEARPEIWAYGFRNPWRATFDRATGDLWAGDVGQGAREEIDLVRAGGNYGWRVMEGNVCTPGVDPNCNTEGFERPIVDYPNAEDCAVTGGFVYRGRRIPELCGVYVYGDYCSGRIWGLRSDGQRATVHRLLLDTNLLISSFGENRSGEIYVIDHGGSVHRIAPAAP